MAGLAAPSYTGVKTVIDPFEGLQKAVSNAGDIYREYEKSSREADIHNAKMQEVERVQFQRDFLKNYDPQLGVQGKGLSDDAKRAAQAEEAEIVQYYADAQARGEEVPDPAELRKRISATYGKLATQESAQQAIMKDFLPYFDPTDAAAYAQSLTSGLVSRASLQEQEKNIADAKREHYKEIREAGDKTLQRQHEGMTARAKVLDVENKVKFGYYSGGGSRTTSGSKPLSGSYQEADEFATALENKISGWPLKIDSNAALDVIHKGLESYNQKRLTSGLPTLPRSEAYNYAYESIGSKWLIDRDINAQTPGEFEVSLEERFNGDAGAFRRGQYGGGGSWGTYRSGGAAAPTGGVASGQPSDQPSGPAYIPPPEANYIRDGLIARGLPEHITAGFLMNMQDESGFKPGVNEEEPLVPGSKGGYGLYQLTGTRRDDYEAFATERGADFADIDTQLDFLVFELLGKEANAAEKIFGTKTQGEAGVAILEHFLRPAEEHRPPRADRYRDFGSGTNTVSGSVTGTSTVTGAGTGAGTSTGSSALTELDRNSANMLRNVVLVEPRSMTEIEKARVKDAFKDYIPRPEAASKKAGSTPTGPQQAARTELAAGVQAAIKKAATKRAEELRAEQDKTVAEKAKGEAGETPGTPGTPDTRSLLEQLDDRSFLADSTLTTAEKLGKLRSNIEDAHTIRNEESLKNWDRLNLERQTVLGNIRKNAEKLESWEDGPYSRERTLELLQLRQEEGALPEQLNRLDSEINQFGGYDSEYRGTKNRRVDELLPSGVPELEKVTGVGPRAAEITRGLLQEYEKNAQPTQSGRPKNRNASQLFDDKVAQTTEYIAKTNPKLAEEIRRAAVFGKQQTDIRLPFIHSVYMEREQHRLAMENLKRLSRDLIIPEALSGAYKEIEDRRKLMENLK